VCRRRAGRSQHDCKEHTFQCAAPMNEGDHHGSG
jgi:hypothetical protein